MAESGIRRTSKRDRIKEEIRRWIREQALAPGERILSQNQLAHVFDATPVTVTKALADLCEENVIHRRKGSGTFVGPPPRGARTDRIGLVLPAAHLDDPATNPFYWPYVQRLMRVFVEAAGEKRSFGTRVILPDAEPEGAAQTLQDYDVVFFHFDRAPRPVIQHVIERGAPAVVRLGGRPDPTLPCLRIDHDQTEGSRCGVEHLLRRGHRRIGFVGSSAFWGGYALDGFRAAHAARRVPVGEHRIVRVGETRDEGARGVAELIEQGLDCDVLFVDSDMRALGVLDRLAEEGLRVPEDVSVMGYDGLDQVVEQPPHLSTVRIPYRELIAEALERVELGEAHEAQDLVRAGDVIEGDTVRDR